MLRDWEDHVKHIKALIASFADPCPPLLYHYTSADKFRNIIESGELRLTNTQFVTDVADCKTLWSLKDLFHDGELACNRYVERSWQQFLKEKNPAGNYYIACFSKAPAIASQWQSYGDICIAFDSVRLQKPGFYLRECVYNKQQIKRWLLDNARAGGWMLSEPGGKVKYSYGDGGTTPSYEDLWDAAAANLIFSASVKLKHRCHRSEDEVRLLAVADYKWDYPNSPHMYDDQPPIHVRREKNAGRRFHYVRYFTTAKKGTCDSGTSHRGKTEYQLKLRKRRWEEQQHKQRGLLPIREILVGPSDEQEERMGECKRLLRKNGYASVKVTAAEGG